MAAEAAASRVEPPVKFRVDGEMYEVTHADTGTVLGHVKKYESYSRQAGTGVHWRVVKPGESAFDRELPTRPTRRDAAWLLVPESER